MTIWGRGGWHVGWTGLGYTDPVSGNGVGSDWSNARHILRNRREQEARRRPETIDVRAFARAYDVPPWLIAGGVPRPRFARLRWALRRVWPV